MELSMAGLAGGAYYQLSLAILKQVYFILQLALASAYRLEWFSDSSAL